MACLSEAHRQNEILTNLWANRDITHTAIICVDIEKWDAVPKANRILEMGLIERSFGTNEIRARHFIVVKNKSKRQRYTEQNTDNFLYGTSENVHNQYALGRILNVAISQAKRHNDVVVLIGHSISSDLKFLRDGIGWELPAGISVLDSQVIWQAQHSESQQPSLGRAMSSFGFSFRPNEAHNSGNDAYRTMEVLFEEAKDAENVIQGWKSHKEFGCVQW